MEPRAIDEANERVCEIFQQGTPVLVDVAPLHELLSGTDRRLLRHAGPPIAWEAMGGPMRGAVLGALVYEGLAASLEEAEALAGSGAVRFEPNHHAGGVGPMAGITSWSMPVFVVKNTTFGNLAYCTINEGIGRAMRFGANDEAVIERLRWMERVLGPALRQAVRAAGGIDLRVLMARALAMGDEMHQRNAAATALFAQTVAPHLVRSWSGPRDALGQVMDFLATNDQFFLNLAMAAAKAIADPARGVVPSTVVTAMARNGQDFGIRVAALGDRWFTAPVHQPEGLYFAGFSAADAHPDIGDSAIVETIGLGGFAMAASPAVARFVGVSSAARAVEYTRMMREITVTQSRHFLIPALDFAGTPLGIDVRRVVSTGILPVINTGIAHRQPGVGQVGAGVVYAPVGCFEQALVAVAESMA